MCVRERGREGERERGREGGRARARESDRERVPWCPARVSRQGQDTKPPADRNDSAASKETGATCRKGAANGSRKTAAWPRPPSPLLPFPSPTLSLSRLPYSFPLPSALQPSTALPPSPSSRDPPSLARRPGPGLAPNQPDRAFSIRTASSLSTSRPPRSLSSIPPPAAPAAPGPARADSGAATRAQRRAMERR